MKRWMKRSALLLLALLSGCASRPQLVMLNPRTGVQVDCELPNPQSSSAEFLTSRACLSACQAHGFRPIPGAKPGTGSGGTPEACTD